MTQMINTNIASLNAQRNLNGSQNSLATALQRLSSGLRINSAKDDAAGLAIASRMTSQINGLNQAARNANDGISMAQTAEGALGQITDNLQRMRELAVQSANGTNSATDRAAIQNEVTQLQSEIDRVATTTAFNGTSLLDGTLQNASFQVGANANQTISMSVGSAKSSALGIGGSANVVGQVTGTTAYTGVGQTINGITIATPTNDGVSYVNGAQAGTTSALAAANAINASSTVTGGVTATAKTTIASGTITSLTALAAGSISINGTDIGAIAGTAVTATDKAGLIVAAVNAVAGTTGVTATLNAGGAAAYTLTAADGRNIDIKNTSGVAQTVILSGFANAAGVATTEYGQVTLKSSSAITTGGATTIMGLTAATYAATGTSVDVTTQSGATTALTSIDAALATINSSRASLGAVQNRFSSVVTNLQTTAENLTASRSRIQDTDFASETGALTRAQILQQAGTAMLAQANSVPNGVLALLR